MKTNSVQLEADDGAHRSVKTWLLLRRIKLAHRSIVLWESFAQWLPTGPSTSSPVEVITSSWATAEPIPQLGENNGSFLQIAVSVRARGAAGSSSEHCVTPELSAILHLYEHFVNRRSRLVANLLTDLALKA